MANGQPPTALPPPLVQTGDFLANRARRLHTMLLALNDVVTSLVQKRVLTTDNAKYRQFKAFLKDWGGWYKNADVGAFWSMSATDATLEGYERSAQSWADWVKSFPGASGDVPNAPPTYPPPKLPSFSVPAWAIGLALLGGGFIAYKVLK